MALAIRCNELVKEYHTQKKVRALDWVDLEVEEGEVFGLLGPNGAGKTTLVRILATLLRATHGRAWVGGYDVVQDEQEVRRIIGYAGQDSERSAYFRLTVRENLLYFGHALHGVPIRTAKERIDAFAHATGDRQWIHCDVERASRESPWKTTIAHGYLTLALTPDLLAQILAIIGWRTAVNTGLDKLRFSSPVPSGSRVRLSASIKDTRDLARNGLRVTFAVRIDVEGSSKPALLANVNYAYFPE